MGLHAIKGKFILNLVAAVLSNLVSVIVAYFIAANSIKSIMLGDLKTFIDKIYETMC